MFTFQPSSFLAGSCLTSDPSTSSSPAAPSTSSCCTCNRRDAICELKYNSTKKKPLPYQNSTSVSEGESGALCCTGQSTAKLPTLRWWKLVPLDNATDVSSAWQPGDPKAVWPGDSQPVGSCSTLARQAYFGKLHRPIRQAGFPAKILMIVKILEEMDLQRSLRPHLLVSASAKSSSTMVRFRCFLGTLEW